MKNPLFLFCLIHIGLIRHFSEILLSCWLWVRIPPGALLFPEETPPYPIYGGVGFKSRTIVGQKIDAEKCFANCYNEFNDTF